MFVESFVGNPEKMAILRRTLSDLNSIGFFPVMFEVGQNRAQPPKDASQEFNAMRATWRDGYEDCLRDIFGFFDKYVPKSSAKGVRPDFGALQEMLDENMINQEEYDRLAAERRAETQR
jgi:hypothetical protein